MYADSELEDRKREFAAAYTRSPQDAMRAALEVDSRPNYAVWIANSWQFDAEVQTYMRELRTEKGVVATIPTKEEFASTLYHDGLELRDKELRLDYFKLFSQVMGYIEKPSQNVINNNVDNRSVVMLPAQQSDDEWQKAASENQAKLLEYTAEK